MSSLFCSFDYTQYADRVREFLKTQHDKEYKNKLKIWQKSKDYEINKAKTYNSCLRDRIINFILNYCNQEYNIILCLTPKPDSEWKRETNTITLGSIINMFLQYVTPDNKFSIEDYIKIILSNMEKKNWNGINIEKHDKRNKKLSDYTYVELNKSIREACNTEEIKPLILDYVNHFSNISGILKKIEDNYEQNKPINTVLKISETEIKKQISGLYRPTITSILTILCLQENPDGCNISNANCSGEIYENGLCKMHGGCNSCKYILKPYELEKSNTKYCKNKSFQNGFCEEHLGIDCMNDEIQFSEIPFGSIVSLITLLSNPSLVPNIGKSYIELNDCKIFLSTSTRKYFKNLLQKIINYKISTYEELKGVLHKPVIPEFYITYKDVRSLLENIFKKFQNNKIADWVENFRDLKQCEIRVDTNSDDDVDNLNDLFQYIMQLFETERITIENLNAFMSGVSSFTNDKEFNKLDGLTYKKYSLCIKKILENLSKYTYDIDTKQLSKDIHKTTQVDGKDIKFSSEEEKIEYLQSLGDKLNLEEIFTTCLQQQRETCMTSDYLPPREINYLESSILENSSNMYSFKLKEIIDIARVTKFCPVITQLRTIFGQEELNKINSNPMLLFLLFITRLLSMIPNDPHCSVEHCSFTKAIKRIRTDKYNILFKKLDSFSEDIKNIILVFGVLISNENACNLLQDYPQIIDLMFVRLCKFYIGVSYTQKLASTNYTLNNLFGSKGIFDNQNCIWHLASPVYRLINYLLGFYVPDSNKSLQEIITTIDESKEPIGESLFPLKIQTEYSIADLVKAFSGLRPSTNFRVFINISNWTPQEKLVSDCSIDTKQPIESFFTWWQILNGPLNKSVQLNFLNRIDKLNYNALKGYETCDKKSFIRQILSTFGFTFGSTQKSFDTSKAKEANISFLWLQGLRYSKKNPFNNDYGF